IATPFKNRPGKEILLSGIVSVLSSISVLSFALFVIMEIEAASIRVANKTIISKDSVMANSFICAIFSGIKGIINFLVRKTVTIDDIPNKRAVFMLTNRFL